MKYLALFALIVCVSYGLVIIDPTSDSGKFFLSPRITWIGKGWDGDLIAEIVPSTVTNKTGRIVLQDIRVIHRGVDQEYLATQAMEEGGIALITALKLPTNLPGFGEYVRTGVSVSMITIPAFEMSQTDTLFVLNLTDYGPVIVNVTNNDHNYWSQVLGNQGFMVSFSVILGSIGLVCISLASYKLALLFLHYGVRSRLLVSTVLIFDLIGNLVRFVYVSVDPLFSRAIYYFLGGQILITLSIPFTLASTLLISLYWREVTVRNNVRVLNFLLKLRWPFWGLVVPMLAIELTTSTLRGLGYPFFTVQLIDGAMYLIVSIFVTVLFLYGGTRVLKALHMLPSSTRTKKISKTTKRLMMSAIFQIIFILMIIIGGITPAMYINGYSFYFIWFIAFLTLYGISFSQIIAFRVPGKPRTRSTRTSTNSNGELSNRSSSKPSKSIIQTSDQPEHTTSVT